MVVVQNRFQERISEAEVDQILDHLLPKIVIDTVQLIFVEDLRQLRVHEHRR